MPQDVPMPVPGRSRAVSRRSLLIGAAWAAPVIAVAATAPFAAASGGDIEIHFHNFTVNKVWAAWPNDWGGVHGNLQVGRNAVGAEFLTELVLTMTFENRLGLTTDLDEVSVSSTTGSWSAQSVSVGATHTFYTFFGFGSLGPNSNTGTLTWSIPTTIVSTIAAIGQFPVIGHMDSPQVVSSITEVVVVT